uniref:Uncharacterized protein n=1 Tax=Arundo donax TaxID=35708 RepID=A0A0A9C6Z5_ARUDO
MLKGQCTSLIMDRFGTNQIWQQNSVECIVNISSKKM